MEAAFIGLVLVSILAFGSVLTGAVNITEMVGAGYCGDGLCSLGESILTCEVDCEEKSDYSVCGDIICSTNENFYRCPQDCPSKCGDGTCDWLYGETYLYCSQDCTPEPSETCGNDKCQTELGENYLNCPNDCEKAFCGNGICEQPYEWTINCPQDCGDVEVCGDNRCGIGEDYFNCPRDCPLQGCGNGICESGRDENLETCPQDCSDEDLFCGDNMCDSTESSNTCPTDCGCISGYQIKNYSSFDAYLLQLSGTREDKINNIKELCSNYIGTYSANNPPRYRELIWGDDISSQCVGDAARYNEPIFWVRFDPDGNAIEKFVRTYYKYPLREGYIIHWDLCFGY